MNIGIAKIMEFNIQVSEEDMTEDLRVDDYLVQTAEKMNLEISQEKIEQEVQWMLQEYLYQLSYVNIISTLFSK